MANNKMNIEGKNYSDIPVWRRYTLTIEEAARYYHIGEGKLRMLIEEHPNEDFYVMNGNRALIKREKFERYLDQATAVELALEMLNRNSEITWHNYTESRICDSIKLQVWLSLF